MAKHETPGPAVPAPDPHDPEPEGAQTLVELGALYSAEYLHECADEQARSERIAELRRRIEAGAYRIDADRIAEEMLVRGDVS